MVYAALKKKNKKNPRSKKYAKNRNRINGMLIGFKPTLIDCVANNNQKQPQFCF